MSLQYRSKINYADILAGNREGFNLGLDGSIFLKLEAVERTFNPPSIGTQGESESAVSASTDISAGTDDSLDIAVDGGTVVTVTLTLAGLTTGAAIAAELETKINAALAAAGQDARVWVEFDAGGPDQYTVHSQSTGTSSTVVITDASSDNVADELNLGTANGGTETAGTNDDDFLLYTTGGPTFEQPIESNNHRTGRFHNDIIKSKKVAEFDIDTMLNMSGTAGDSLDTAVKLLWKSIFGTETVTASTSIKYTQGLPNFTFTMVRASTIFGEYYTGAYAKDMTMTIPGDAPVTIKYTGRAATATIAGIGQADGAVAAAALITLNAGHAERFEEGSRVMVVGADGRTITAGFDGNLTVLTEDAPSNQITLSAAVDVEDDGYIAFWHPGAVQQTGRDAIFTDLEGSMKLNASGSAICVTNMELAYVNDHVDIDNCFGLDRNDGFVAGNRATITLSATMDLSNENMGDLVQARKFGGFSPEIIIGNTSDRHLKITAPKWIVSIPPIDLPENGTTPFTFEGVFYQSESGARDPIEATFL